MKQTQLQVQQNSFISSLNLSKADHVILQDAFLTFTSAIAANSTNYDAYVQLGTSLHDKCYHEAAILTYNQALSLRPQDATVFCHLGDSLCEVSRFSEAIDAYNKSIQINPAVPEVYLNLAFALYTYSKPEEAIEATQKALQLDSQLSHAYLMQSGILYQQYRDTEAKEVIMIAEKHWLVLNRIRTDCGVDLYEAGKTEEAIKAYEANFTDDFKWMCIYIRLSSKMKINSNMIAIAKKVCEIALLSNPRNLYASLSLAIILNDIDQNKKKAEEILEALTKINRKHYETYNWLGYVLDQQGKRWKATQVTSRATELNNRDERSNNNLGWTLVNQGRMEEGIKRYRKAIEFNPYYLVSYNNLGHALVTTGRVEEGMDVYRTAIKVRPQDGSAYYNLGNALRRRVNEAADMFVTFTNLEPHDVQVLGGIVDTLLSIGQVERAFRMLRKAQINNPNSPVVYQQTARVHFTFGDKRSAIQFLSRAMLLHSREGSHSTETRDLLTRYERDYHPVFLDKI